MIVRNLIIVLMLTIFTTMVQAEETVLRDLMAKHTQNFYKDLELDRNFYDDQPRELRQLVEQHFDHFFDWQRMSRFVLGKYSRTTNKDDMATFTQAFRELLLNSYATVMLRYSFDQFVFLPERTGRREGTYILKTITQTGTKDIPIEYYVIASATDQKIIDVRVEGLSLLINYRKAFAEEIQNKSVQALIENIKARNKKVQ